ncbi:MAG: GGDEF domain-containing protein [Elusimicrobiota bacterium]
MKLTIGRKGILSYIVIIAFIVSGTVVLFLNENAGNHIIGLLSILIVMWIGLVKRDTLLMVVLILLIVEYFLFLVKPGYDYYSLIVLLTPLVVITIDRIEKRNNERYKIKMELLKKDYDEINKENSQIELQIDELEKKIERYSQLYEISKDFEGLLSSSEIINRSIKYFSLRINIKKLAFFRVVDNEYIVLKTLNISEKQANAWLNELDKIENSPGDKKFKFLLNSGEKDLGLILCQGKLNEQKIKEAKVLIYQITLGFEKAILYEKVKELSRIDGLTGLYLRRYFYERFSEEIKRAKRENYKVAFLMTDLDNFKEYNDTYGHPMGDKLLKQTADIIRDNIYSTDFAGRYGGEEFCIYMPMAEKEGTLKKAEEIKNYIEKNIPLTISIGISYYPNDGKTPAELTKKADEALYYVKEHGKNGIHWFSKNQS